MINSWANLNKRIVLTGPESTGKTTLAKALSELLECTFIPEYAREYLNQLNRDYTYQDVLNMAQGQWNSMDKISNRNRAVFDTDMLTYIIWLEHKYSKCPERIITWFENCNVDLYLVCYPDLLWEPDPLRENPNDLMELYQEHIQVLEKYQKKYVVVQGQGDHRLLSVKAGLIHSFPRSF